MNKRKGCVGSLCEFWPWTVHQSSGRPWEEELCWGSGARGVVYVGDSVGAHFHAPPVWFTPKEVRTFL